VTTVKTFRDTTTPVSPKAPAAAAAPTVALWLVAWIGLVVIVNVFWPAWKTGTDADLTPLVAASNPAALSRIDHAFPGSGTDDTAYVVVEAANRPQGIPRDYVDALSQRLQRDATAVRSVSDMSGDPLTAPAVECSDRRCIYLQTWLRGDLGSREALTSLASIHAAVHAMPLPAGLRVYVTGPAAAAAAQHDAASRYQPMVALAVLVATTLVVLALSRTLTFSGVVLMSAWVASAISLSVAHMMGNLLSAPSVPSTPPLTLALAVGAALSASLVIAENYRRQLRADHSHEAALSRARQLAVPTVLAPAALSAGLLGWGGLLGAAELRGVGIAVGIAVLIAPLMVLSLMPGWARRVGRNPALRITNASGRPMRVRSCGWLFRRPKFALACVAATVVGCLVGLAGMHVWFADPSTHPRGSESTVGYAAAARDFPANRLTSQQVVIYSPRDLRNPAGLLAIERVTRKLMALPGVRRVQSASWPAGLPWPEATLAEQFGTINRKLQSDALSSVPLAADIAKLPSELDHFASSFGDVQQTLKGGVAGAQSLRTSLETLQTSAANINATASTLSHYADPIRQWMGGYADCSADFICSRVASVIQPVDATLADMSNVVASTKNLSDSIAKEATMLTAVSHTVAETGPAIAQMKPLVDGLAVSVNKVMPQLTQMTSFINVVTDDLSHSGEGGFYLPQEIIDSPKYRAVKAQMFSGDGHATRLFVYSDGTASGPQGAGVAAATMPAIAEVTKYGSLADSSADTIGPGFATNALQSQWHNAFQQKVLWAAAVMVVISSLALRTVRGGMAVAAAVLVAFLSGLGVYAWLGSQHPGRDIHWPSPVAALIIVAAIVADDAYRLVARIISHSKSTAQRRSTPFYGSGWPLVTFGMIWAAAAGGSASAFGQIGAITAISVLLSSILFRITVIGATSLTARSLTAAHR
jgi:putative drug exporter of the RND superfamily